MTWVDNEVYYRFTDWWMDCPISPGTEVHPLDALETNWKQFSSALSNIIATSSSAITSLQSLVTLWQPSSRPPNFPPKTGRPLPRINNTGPRSSWHFDPKGRKCM